MVMSIKRITCLPIFALFVFFSTALAEPIKNEVVVDEVVESIDIPISSRIEHQLKRNRRVAGAKLHSRPLMRTFYTARDFLPAWSDNGKVVSQVEALRNVTEGLWDQGIDPGLYHGQKIEEILDSLSEHEGQKRVSALADLDLLLTDTFFLIGAHLSSGLFNPYRNWMVMFRMPPRVNLSALLEGALNGGSVQKTLEGLLPTIGGYPQLVAELARMRQLAIRGGWPNVPKVKKLEPGAIDPRIADVRRRLEAAGEIPISKEKEDPTGSEVYDEELVRAVTEFQRRHGLEPDGIIGRGTVAAMNVPAEKRACQLIINMDRVRYMARRFREPNYVVVNIPAFEVRVFEKEKQIMDMRAIVGRKDRETPVMSNKLRYLVFSPKWRVPTTIAVEDKLPLIQKDPGYLESRGMTLFAEEGEEVDPYLVDWSQMGAENFPYHIVQDPGRANAMGRVKFMFPNRYSVYLHDTPSKYLFKRQVRMFSSGCIRISKPVELAQYLLRDKKGWDRRRIREAMNREKVLYVNLPEPVPIHLLYLTAWVDGEGDVVFYNDIYKRDRAYKRKLCRD